MLCRKSKTDSVATPSYILEPLRREFGAMYDPCPLQPNWDAAVHKDGLTTEWGPVSFVNPPFSKTAKFLRKAHEQWCQNKTIVFLMKTQSVSTKAYGKYSKGAELRILTGRVVFPGYETPLLSPILLLVFRAGQTSDRWRCVDMKVNAGPGVRHTGAS